MKRSVSLRGKNGDGVGGSISGRETTGDTVVVGVGAGAAGIYGDGASESVFDIGVGRVVEALNGEGCAVYGRRRGRSGSWNAALDLRSALYLLASL